MLTIFTIFHILIALVLIALVLVQDSKGGGALGMGGGSNSFLGATGAQTLASTLTKWTASLFAISCLILAANIGSQPKSVLGNLAPPTAPETVAPPPNAAPGGSPEGTSAAAPAQSTNESKTQSAPSPTGPTPGQGGEPVNTTK